MPSHNDQQQEQHARSLKEKKDKIRDDISEPVIPLNVHPLKEFLQALLNPHTYKIHRNVHAVFGILWGLPVPVMAVLLSLYHVHPADGTITINHLLDVALQTPLHYAFYLCPIISCIVFGAMGTIRKQKDRRIRDYMDRLEEMTLTDFLTGLPNHRHTWIRLNEEIEKADREDTNVSILICDLDGFKAINDNFGHDIGDRCLKAIAGLLRDVCREYDVVARYGGDEFIFILPDSTSQDALQVAERIKQFLNQTGPILEVDGTPLRLGLSIGVATYPEDGPRPEDLMRTADQLMYKDKTNNHEPTLNHETHG
jgi:diguanylate cyclase (GGDEF)-like protein